MSETTFFNVMITIDAENPKAAYDKLCTMFYKLVRTGDLEFAIQGGH